MTKISQTRELKGWQAENIQEFRSTSNDKCFPVGKFINYNSKYVVYLITYTSCRVQYNLKHVLGDTYQTARNSLAFNISNASHQFIQVHNKTSVHLSFTALNDLYAQLEEVTLENCF